METLEILRKTNSVHWRDFSENAHLQLEHPAVQHALVRCRVAVRIQHVNCIHHPVLQLFNPEGELTVFGNDSIQPGHFLLETTDMVFELAIPQRLRSLKPLEL